MFTDTKILNLKTKEKLYKINDRYGLLKRRNPHLVLDIFNALKTLSGA